MIAQFCNTYIDVTHGSSTCKRVQQANLHGVQVREIDLSTDVQAHQWKSDGDEKEGEDEHERGRLSDYVGQNPECEDVAKQPPTSSIFFQFF